MSDVPTNYASDHQTFLRTQPQNCFDEADSVVTANSGILPDQT
jgi:hypothetical protein